MEAISQWRHLYFFLVLCLHFEPSHQVTIDQRHSYSLSTFDVHGKLSQVERAMEAASHGVPLLAVVHSMGVLMMAPQLLPSPLCIDDGTSRFAQVTSQIMVAHSGITADGRVLVTAAKRLAIEHEYTFEEEIGISMFLNEISLLFQEYTMKPGARPFGSSLLVAHLSLDDDDDSQMYTVDPSGNIRSLGRVAVINWKEGNLQAAAEKALEEEASLQETTDTLLAVFREALLDSKQQQGDDSVPDRRPLALLTASLTSSETFTKSKQSLR